MHSPNDPAHHDAQHRSNTQRHPFEPAKGNELPGRLALAGGLTVQHLQDRSALCRQFDQVGRTLEAAAYMQAVDRYTEMAYDMVLSPRVGRLLI